MTQNAAAKKDTQKLQRAIVDGLEDVKAHDIQVFNTEHLSPLFERVIVASGTSNRQTKALASSVRDSVREAGFPKPRIEGEENGEWIIVDCGAAVAHIMQPAIRQYYHLEEIWGDKPVRVKFGAAKPAMPSEPVDEPAPRPAAKKTSAGKAPATGARHGAGAPAKKGTAKAAGRATGAPAKKATAKKTPVHHTAKPPARKSAGTGAARPAAKKSGAKAAGRTAAKRPAAKKTSPRR
jgi:ribosome-associated protein